MKKNTISKGNTTVTEIVKNWLKEHGFDGLYNVDLQCGCAVDDFALCGQIYLDCQAGYKTNIGSGSEDDYGIGPEKDLWYWSKRTQKVKTRKKCRKNEKD